MNEELVRLVPVSPIILMDDDPLLRTVSVPVEKFGDALTTLAATMIGVLHEQGGRGLAAVQIGVPLRVLIIREGVRPNFTYLAMVNPTLERTLNRFTTEREGCLSVPQFKWGNVSRPAKCDVSWFGVGGQPHRASLTGDTARIFQHEFDHLNGVLMTDKVQ
jgi:peptide deformylase